MPLYTIYHSLPLEQKQKTRLAEEITRLHAHTFTTPSMFVNVQFLQEDATELNYYVAGVPRPHCTNRILAMVRTSPTRTKAVLDELAAQIEALWYDTVMGEVLTEGKDAGKRHRYAEETETSSEAKRLGFVVFHPMLAARESGMVIPGAGEEGMWLKENMPMFRERAEGKGDKDFQNLVKEIETREDLKKLIG